MLTGGGSGVFVIAAEPAAAHNPVLTDLFAGFVPVLRVGLVDLLALTGARGRGR
ncbi:MULTISPECIES: hypothetical protein [Streptomyces]|uniref:Uncharacterized protein n=2 Tax=Streptomyces TaxID=1883 RepID=A0ABV9IU25_9ACTN